MRTKLLLHIQELPGKYFTEQKTGDILKVIDSDVSALEETGIDFVIDIIKNLLSAISAFVILACINTKLLLIMILMETFMLFLHEKYIKLVSKKLERVRDISGKSLIEGAIIGGIFLIISVVTREKIGYGDSLVFLAIGLIMGGEKCFVIILWSFLLCSIFSLVAIILKKTTFKSTVAFMPFVLAGALVTFISTQ